jgi:hypothetical protein
MASNAVPTGGADDAIVRGELVHKDGQGPTLVAIRRLRWGTAILGERPLLFVEADPNVYLKAKDADERLSALAEAMGDPVRVATYVAFKQLHERKQKELLDFWTDDLEATDEIAKAIFEQNQNGCNAFLQDRPDFSSLIYWLHFVKVVSIFGRFGMVNPDGSRAVYGICSHLRHSSKPNAAWYTLSRGYPKGRKVLHVIGINGIERGAEITVSLVPEAVLLMPRVQRLLRIKRITGKDSDGPLSTRSDQDDERVREEFEKLQRLLGVRPPTDESTAEAEEVLRRLDVLLPFSMQAKAKAKVFLAQAMQELTNRAAWQDSNKEGNIIQWTGLDAEAQERRLKSTKKLYESASKDFEYLLGQDAIGILDKLEVGYAPVNDQHTMISRYNKDREREAEAIARQQMQLEFKGSGRTMGDLPPVWEELLKERPNLEKFK